MKKRYCLIGLGKIGFNLAISLNNKGFDFDFWDIDKTKVQKLSYVLKKKPLKNFKDYLNKKKQTIFLLLIPNQKINFFIKTNIKLIKKNDIIIDLGNSNPDQTYKNHVYLKRFGILFFGIGFSGGVKGASNTPCLMISGKKKDINKISHILQTILNNKKFYVIGEDSRLGHLSKICHNSIEYGLMKLIGEYYILQKNIFKFSLPKILNNFKKMGVKNPNFYLLDLSNEILLDKKKLLYNNTISDIIEHNKTSKWFNILCLENEIIYPTLINGIENRILSKNTKKFYMKKNKIYKESIYSDYIDLFSSTFFICYIQGILALLEICKIKKIKINLNNLLKVWYKNSIISSNHIKLINKNFTRRDINNLKFFSYKEINKINSDLTSIITLFLKNQENPSGLFSIFNWVNSHNFFKKDDNIFINLLRNTFGNHKLYKN